MANTILLDSGVGTRVITKTALVNDSSGIKPGTICKLDSNGEFVKAGSGDKNTALYVLDRRGYLGETVDAVQADNNTASAFEVLPGMTFQVRAGGDSFVLNAKVAAGNNGQLVDSGATDQTFGVVVEASTSTTADRLIKVRTI